MTNEFLRPLDLRTYVDTPSSTPSKRPRSKSATTSTSRTSWTSSLARRLVKESRNSAVRAGLDKAGYEQGHKKAKVEDPSTAAPRDLQGTSALPGDLEIGAVFDLVDHRLPQNLPPDLVLIPPTAPASLQSSDHDMANNNQTPLGVWEAARILSSHGCKVKLLPIPPNNAHAPVARPPRQTQGQDRTSFRDKHTDGSIVRRKLL